MKAFNVLTTTAMELQTLLEAREISTVDIVKAYLAQINRHNLHGMKLRALITVASTDDLLEQARRLDEERETKGARIQFNNKHADEEMPEGKVRPSP